jgi:hypothetical protein
LTFCISALPRFSTVLRVTMTFSTDCWYKIIKEQIFVGPKKIRTEATRIACHPSSKGWVTMACSRQFLALRKAIMMPSETHPHMSHVNVKPRPYSSCGSYCCYHYFESYS